MDQPYIGSQAVTDEDRAYAGSRFAEVRDALFANPYQEAWRRGSGKFPVYEVTVASVLRGILPGGKPYTFGQAVHRSVDSHADLRWGSSGRGFRRLLHPNGICLTGLWEITEPSPYTGYFSQGSRALIVGRYSTCCTEVRRGYTRSLSLVGKLYPTTDPDHHTSLRTAGFITQQDIGGDRSDAINDAVLLNAPNITAWRRGLQVLGILVEGVVFGLADRKADMRQVYPIAELGLPEGTKGRSPMFMRLRVADEQPRVDGYKLDFRDEVMAHLYDDGDPAPKRTLVFDIDVTDNNLKLGVPVFQRRYFKNWRHLGRITFDRAVASYNGDFVIHFNHPTWRTDLNDPATATRKNERRTRWL